MDMLHNNQAEFDNFKPNFKSKNLQTVKSQINNKSTDFIWRSCLIVELNIALTKSFLDNKQGNFVSQTMWLIWKPQGLMKIGKEEMRPNKMVD